MADGGQAPKRPRHKGAKGGRPQGQARPPPSAAAAAQEDVALPHSGVEIDGMP